MPSEYSAFSHDWDLTISAAHQLLMLGQQLDRLPKEGTLCKGFSAYTGSMLLSFCAIESFSASIAFSMSSEPQFINFNFEEYRNASRFWDKLEMLCTEIGLGIDKSRGIFQRISEMQQWRNSVAHASPYEIPPTYIENTTTEPSLLHAPFKHKSYPRITDAEHARAFYKTAIEYIELVKERSGLSPLTTIAYKVG